MNVKELGQVFTPNNIVEQLLSLRINSGKCLEPSSGNGAIMSRIDGCIGIELDSAQCCGGSLNMDFFDYNELGFDTIIGNPPYLAHNAILSETKEKLDYSIFDKRSNLYLFFIKKCIDMLSENGELIFITPIDFIKHTSSIKLNNFIFEQGTITHFYDYGDEVVFKGFSPNVVVWRFQKNNFSRKTLTNDGIKSFINMNGQLKFTNEVYDIEFKDLFYVKVGAVSGLDRVFISDNGNKDFVCSTTRTDGKLRRMFYNIVDKDLLEHKEALLNRKIKKFNNDNWFNWGRGFHDSNDERIYVNCKTRKENPFFISDCNNYDGSVLAIFIKDGSRTREEYCSLLNTVNWSELSFKVGGRYMFSQKSLENILLPCMFK